MPRWTNKLVGRVIRMSKLRIGSGAPGVEGMRETEAFIILNTLSLMQNYSGRILLKHNKTK